MSELIASLQSKSGGKPALAAFSALLTSLSRSGGLAFADAAAYLQRLPWHWPAAMREVVRILGRLTAWEPLAYKELAIIAATREEAQQSTVVVLILDVMQDFLARPEAQELFTKAAASNVVEVATAAAVVPLSSAVLRSPGVVAHVVAVFTKLLSHPDLSVRVHAAQTWAREAEYIPIEDGMAVVKRFFAISHDPLSSKYEVGEAKSAVQSWLTRVCQASDTEPPPTRPREVVASSLVPGRRSRWDGYDTEDDVGDDDDGDDGGDEDVDGYDGGYGEGDGNSGDGDDDDDEDYDGDD